ncbi:hypothetical protein DAETH_47030 (plasmid) [Deinococcus aetherius]|uniref:Transposase InsH N-terminal domain-containing protein n=1 Tax=Deinococcus aetherius TaxID=200252 RepID=A0ABM8ALL5_9DEIO|nr:transposase [Deinococcus aetherius]BDP44734.1 hypothetical protein DAETH_47030 [Deinococcus aetherius]
MLRPDPLGPVPKDTARISHAAFPKGNLYLKLRDELGVLYADEDFAALFPALGQPALPPWRLALVTVVQFLENLTDRQAADQVRARLDLKYLLGLELSDPGFDFSVLSEFRARLVAGNAEHLLLDRMLTRFREKGLLKRRGQQRTDSTHVLAAIRHLTRIEFVAETFRATLNAVTGWPRDWTHAGGSGTNTVSSRIAFPRERTLGWPMYGRSGKTAFRCSTACTPIPVRPRC